MSPPATLRLVGRGTFLGWQPRPGGRAPIPIFVLDHAIAGHPARSTLSGRTLLEAGYAPPAIPCVDCPAPAAWVLYGPDRLEPEVLTGSARCARHLPRGGDPVALVPVTLALRV